jgi:glucose-6-phosphate isomerase
MDNIDPSTFHVLDFLRPEKTIFNIITKSGTTAETISQFLIVRKMLEDKLGKKAVREHLVVTTGDSPLKELAEKEGYSFLPIPENVGGRFSVLTPVGLFPAAMFGVDILELLAGAREMDERCRTPQLWQNPAYLAGALYYLANVKKGLNIAVMMPYCDALFEMAYWFRQLWAESLGKAKNLSGQTVNAGQTPVVALGVTDQHSQLQLYTEGPFDKLITFLVEENIGEKMPIPIQKGQPEWMAYLGGHSLEELINIEAQSTRLALTKAGRSNMCITLPEANAFTIGQLIFLLEVQTVFAGGLYNVNPMDQPGVESGKHYIYGMMGRRGFEDKGREAREWLERKSEYVI